jgi:DNA-binding XRE family transcriptional regulator
MNDAGKSDTVTLSRTEYEALLERIQDAEDKAAIDRLEARIANEGFDVATRNYLPLGLMQRLLKGEHPIRVWRAHRGLTREMLAERAGVAPSYVTEIETGRKPGSFDALARLGHALDISLDDLASWLKPGGGRSG